MDIYLYATIGKLEDRIAALENAMEEIRKPVGQLEGQDVEPAQR